MKISKVSAVSAVVGASIMFIGSVAHAAVATATTTVSAVVSPLVVACSVTPPASVALPSMIPGITSSRTQSFVVSTTCSLTTPYSVSFTSANGGAAGGKLNGTNCAVTYGIYSISGTLIGTTNYFLNPVPASTGTGTAQLTTYVLSAPVAQPGCSLAQGSASQTVTDTMTVSVNY
jgi:hypothetical protein